MGCNSLYRKDALIEAGGFNIKLSVNEDTELNSRIRKIGKIFYVPKAVVLHDLNIGPKDFAKRNFTFGRWRARLRLFDLQCIPPIALLILIPFSFFYFWILIGVFCLYLLAVFGMGLKGALAKNRKSMLFFVPIAYLIEHLSYSTGFWLGLLKK